MLITGFIPGLPIAKGRPRMTRSGHTYTPAKTRQAEAYLQKWLLNHYAGEPSKQAISLTLMFGFKRPASNKTAKHMQRPDLDNLIKTIKDAANGVLWVDDSQVIYLTAEKLWADESGIEIMVEEIP